MLWPPPYETPVTPMSVGLTIPWSARRPSRYCVSRASYLVSASRMYPWPQGPE